MPKAMINGVLTDISLDQIFQDDGTTPFPAPPTGPVFTAQDIERARSEEKDKLYNQLERTREELTALNEQVGGLTAAQQRREAELEQEQERLAEEARRAEEGNLDPRVLLERQQNEWNRRLQETEASFQQRLDEQERVRQEEVALRAKEQEFSALQQYTTDQIAANEESIAPQLRQFVTGSTREEVDASIARAIQSTNEITAEMQQMLGQQQQPQVDPVTGQPFQTPAPSPVPAPPATPGTGSNSGPSFADPQGQFSQQLTPEQISNMPMSEYAALRSKMGIGGQGNNRGLLG